MAKSAKKSYRATRTEKVAAGPFERTLVAGEVYDDIPEDVAEALSGDYGGLEEVTDDE